MPIVAEMKKQLLQQEVLHADETTMLVLRKPRKSAEGTSS
ncbi:transposase [Paenibacillus lentus]